MLKNIHWLTITVACLTSSYLRKTKAALPNYTTIDNCYSGSISITGKFEKDAKTLSIDEDASAAQSDLSISPYLNQDINKLPFNCALTCAQEDFLCAVQIVQIPDSVAGVPFKSVNGIKGKWRISKLFFRDIRQ